MAYYPQPVVEPLSRMNRTSIAARTQFTAAMLVSVTLLFAVSPKRVKAETPRRDVQLIGLAPLYEALFAVANCRNVALDEPAFRRAARLYHLSTTDLTIGGDFSPEIAALAADYQIRLEDDRVAFCDARRLHFAVPQGILTDLGPEIPNPLHLPQP